MGVGQIGLSLDEFETMTPAQFITIWAGYAAKEARNERARWERTRNATAILFNIQLAAQNRLSPDELWPLPWDEQTTHTAGETITREERIERMNALIKGE